MSVTTILFGCGCEARCVPSVACSGVEFSVFVWRLEMAESVSGVSDGGAICDCERIC